MKVSGRFMVRAAVCVVAVVFFAVILGLSFAGEGEERVGVLYLKISGDIGIKNPQKTIEAMFIKKLSENVETVERKELVIILRKMKVEASKLEYNRKLMPEILSKHGVRYLVTGTITKSSPASEKIAVSAKLIDVKSGDKIGTAWVSADGADEIENSLGEIAEKFAAKIAEQPEEEEVEEPEEKPEEKKEEPNEDEEEKPAVKKEAAIEAGLKWLSLHQLDSGIWSAVGFQGKCGGKDAPCSHVNAHPPANNFDVGVTALVVLAFMGAGETHLKGEYKDALGKAIDWLIARQNGQTGFIGSSLGESAVYNHAIATRAICEAFSITGDEKLKGPAQKAVDYIIKAQNPGAGWKYQPGDGKSDTSVTGWMIMALTAAKKGNLKFPEKKVFEGAIAWFDNVTREKDGQAGYVRAGDKGAKLAGRPPDSFQLFPTMTAVAILNRIYCGQKPSHAMIKKGAKLLRANLPEYNEPKFNKVNFYYWYYGTYAMRMVGGKDWKTWRTPLKKALLDSQRKDDTCASGSWDPVGEWCIVGGRVYATAINVITLNLYYSSAK
ncbi:MAG: hypothetical protein ACYS8W_21065 [Planctomycetota bacterium]|jgi:TolB-like protein